jgi:hypothetical protein
MPEARHDTAEARLKADAAEGAVPGGRHRGPASTKDDNEAAVAHGRHRRAGEFISGEA